MIGCIYEKLSFANINKEVETLFFVSNEFDISEFDKLR